MTRCRDCDGEGTVFLSPFDGEALCAECAGREIEGLLEGLSPQDLARVRRRVEDCLRKNPRALIGVATSLATARLIRVYDLV